MVLTLDVRDATTLWRAAARRLRAAGLAPEAIEETIGSIDAPSPGDCLTALMLPDTLDADALGGCELADFAVRPACPIDDIPGSDIVPIVKGH
jgi:hypothetical protein